MARWCSSSPVRMRCRGSNLVKEELKSPPPPKTLIPPAPRPFAGAHCFAPLHRRHCRNTPHHVTPSPMPPDLAPTRLDEMVRSPFQRLASLLEGITPGAPVIDVSLGGPTPLLPPFLWPTLIDHSP